MKIEIYNKNSFKNGRKTFSRRAEWIEKANVHYGAFNGGTSSKTERGINRLRCQVDHKDKRRRIGHSL
jgi:hypothetical protein